MRHWTTSFQLLDRSPQYGLVRRAAQRGERVEALLLNQFDAFSAHFAGALTAGRSLMKTSDAAVGRTGQGADRAMPAYAF